MGLSDHDTRHFIRLEIKILNSYILMAFILSESKKEAEFDKLLLDTTLLAYDDGLSFLMKTNQQKAKSK